MHKVQSVGLITILVATGGLLRAQAPTPTPTPVPAKKSFGYVRFINMRGDKTDLLQLINPASPTKDIPISSAPPLNFFAQYIKLPGGVYNFQVVRGGDMTTPLKSLPVITLKSDMCVTLLVREVGGAITVEAIDDTFVLDKTPNGTVTVRDFWPGADVSVTAMGRPPVSVTVQEGTEAKLEGLPAKIVPLLIKARQANGSEKRWNTEADFTKGKRKATLFIIPDRYNRFRPCIADEGHVNDEVELLDAR